MSKNFGLWLQKELNKKDMSQADLSRSSGVTSAQISRIISGSRGAGKDALQAIALGLNISEDIIFREAGFLSQKLDVDPITRQLIHLISQLSEEDQEELAFIAEAKLKRNARQKQPKTTLATT